MSIKMLFYIAFLAWTSDLVTGSIYNVNSRNYHENEIDGIRGPQNVLRTEKKFNPKEEIRILASSQHATVKLPSYIDLAMKLPDEFDDLHKKYRDLLVSDYFDKTNAAVVKYVNTLSKEVEPYYKTVRSDKRLWLNKEKLTRSSDLYVQFSILRKLALAYGTNGTKYYKNADLLLTLKECLMVSTKIYDGKLYYGNWWNWQIGVPTCMLDILMILKNELSVKDLKKYTEIINSYVHDPYYQLLGASERKISYVENISKIKASSSQTVELARVVLGLGILQKNNTKIFESIDSIVKIMRPVTKGDGFYKDGSYIEHKYIPYTGTYGNELVKKFSEILVITKDSKLAIPFKQVKLLVTFVMRAFLPFIYRGEMIAPVKGRAISREPYSTQVGSKTMYTLLTVATFASAKQKKKLQDAVKYWIRHNPDYYFSNADTYFDLLITIRLLNNSAIAPYILTSELGDNLPFVGAKMYASMDRFVQQTVNYTLGLSMYSDRISAFEAGNQENKRGWHTADGAIYLYNYDDVQFRNAYWPTVDPYRFPGTTVDTIYLSDEFSCWEKFTSKEKWVGGVASDSEAVVGMALNKNGFRNYKNFLSMNLKAKKSWFIIENQIVALGAGITGLTSASIETIVDNRLLNDAYKYEVLYQHGSIKASRKKLVVDWLYLMSDNERSSIGYYFPNSETVDVIFESRNGTYKDINNHYSNKVYTGTYRKFIINHGQRPVNAKYAYVILPGIKLSVLNAYANDKTVNILENSYDLQAVELRKKGYLGINIWSEDGGAIKGISSNKPVSLMRQTKGQKQKYVFSDPTQSDRVITLKIPDFAKVSSISDEIKYDEKSKDFVVDFTGAHGARRHFTVMTK